jgi:hypothetical protein
MKNLFKTMLATGLISVALTHHSFAQERYANAVAVDINRDVIADDYNKGALANVSTAVATTTNPLLLTRFAAQFPLATNQLWAINNSSFGVTFLNNGRKTTASFTQKGQLNYVIAVCNLEQLPASFRCTISKDYAMYKLYNAIEMKAYDAVVYQVVLEGAQHYITLKFTNEGVEEIERLSKSN